MFSQTSASPSATPSCGRVVVVGSINQDLTTYTSSLPVLGETVLGESFQTSRGGKGANQACAAASLQMAAVSMVCRVGGADSFGSALLDDLHMAGVQVDREASVVPNKSSGMAAITVDTKSGDNMIVVTPGANLALTPKDVEISLNKIAKTSTVSVVLVQLEISLDAALQALKAGKELGAITILNPAPAPQGSSLDELYPYVDILIPNETELRELCGVASADERDEADLAKCLLDKGVRQALVVTLGARGAMTLAREGEGVEVTMVDAPTDLPAREQEVKDTIGAGDGFCGALSIYLAMGLTLSEAAGKACGVASMSVRRQGASYPTWDELPESLKVDSPRTVAESKPKITFVTGNKKKLEEVHQILCADTDFGFELTSHKVDLPELQGDPVEIAIEKCKIAAEAIKGPCLTEDTSLCFNALNGMPGPYIKWFLDSCGHDGLNSMLVGFNDNTAYAQTVVAFTAGPGEKVHVFDGRTEGKIVVARGPLDFGWDPIFEPHESGGKTYAEMAKADKNAISHRGRSFAKLKAFLVDSSVGDTLV
jgi:ribokinase/non-canonical purine NTP pyrophosphatase (RdgB/HAM1 family)